MPELYSEEWNETCGTRPISIRDDALVPPAYFQFNYFMIAFMTCYFSIGSFGFWYAQRSLRSSYLLKRNILSVFLAAVGAMCIMGVGPIADVIGRQNFPCLATLWLRILGVVNVLLPLSIRLIFFREQMLWSKAKKAISFQKLQEIIASDNLPTSPGLSRKSIFQVRSPNSKVARVTNTEIVTRESIDEQDKSELGSQISSERHDRKGMSSGASTTDAEQFERLMRRQGFGFKFVAILLPTLPLFGYAVIYSATKPYLLANCNGCFEDLVSYLIIAGTISVLANVIVFFGYLVRNSPDPLGLLDEMKSLLLWSTGPGGVGLILSTLDQVIGRPYDRGVFSPDWILLFALCVEFFFLGYRPVFRAVRLSQRVVTGTRYDFESFLNNPKAYKLFADHLVNEWAIENLKFWSQVESFRNQYSHFKKIRDGNVVAIQTFNTFIKPGALMDVNLPSQIRDQLIELFENHMREDPDLTTKAIPATVFNEAQLEIFALMERDSFQRFQHTTAFKDFVTSNTVLDPAKQRMVAVTASIS